MGIFGMFSKKNQTIHQNERHKSVDYYEAYIQNK